MAMNGVPNRAVVLRPVGVERLDLSDRRLTVFGGTNGLGRAIAWQALARGAEVTVVGRTFRSDPQARLTFVRADLSSMREAVRLGRELPVETHDLVVFTLGVSASPARRETDERVERDMAVSYLSRFAVMQGLSARLGASRPAAPPRPRVFVMGAPGSGVLGDPDDLNSEKPYKALRAHLNTVAGNEALVLGGADRLPGPAYFGLNPGLIRTDIRSEFLGGGSLKHRLTETVIGWVGQSPQAYAKRIVPLLFAPELEGQTGLLFNNKARPILPSRGFDRARTERFLTGSEALLRHALG
ncbi:SDR family NAD(P)-dependent oxidoreductase [Streptomyces humi]|uniref:SDR family NAD(P)-dependent oxidoreductase n=1 Tax=Streptomyces humi TaxID=1428620 RepID=UPI0019D2AAF5|nr:SDR family NAD(P)-dependent oxidoreductase [Streptomyces humi]